MIFVYSLLISVYFIHYLLFLSLSYILTLISHGSSGVGVEDRISNPEVVSSIPLRAISPFSQEKSPEFSGDYGKLRLITGNFGTWGSKFPDHIEHSFSLPLTVWSGAIRSGWRNSAYGLVTVQDKASIIRIWIPLDPNIHGSRGFVLKIRILRLSSKRSLSLREEHL